jgi:hypothetical protein
MQPSPLAPRGFRPLRGARRVRRSAAMRGAIARCDRSVGSYFQNPYKVLYWRAGDVSVGHTSTVDTYHLPKRFPAVARWSFDARPPPLRHGEGRASMPDTTDLLVWLRFVRGVARWWRLEQADHGDVSLTPHAIEAHRIRKVVSR